MTDASSAPPVVVVMVTRNAGPWFEETLDGLAAQDYPRLAVLVLDNSGDSDPTPLVAERLPHAAVRRLDADEGYGAAANRVEGLVEGAAFYLFCHDDVVLAPDAVSVMVAEAVRGNAGIVGPKQVGWAEPDRLVAVGASVDRVGVPAPLVEQGELDQEQHDRVRDVMWVPGGAILVRSDLFVELGGFDEAITYLGEDLDLCWRAQLAGARVVVAPDAVIRHLQALGERRGDDRRRLQSRHRLRTLFAVTGRLRMLWVLPLAMFFSLIEALYAVVAGRPSHARDILGGWAWNLRRFPSLLAKRRRVNRSRKVVDSEIAHLQIGGSSRFKSFLRGQLNRDDRLTSLGDAGRSLASSLTVGGGRTSAASWTLVIIVLVTQVRHLITRGIPAIGEFGVFPDGSTLRRVTSSGLRDSWLGTASGRPLGPGLLGLADAVPLTTAALRTVLILGPLIVGLVGAWRLVGPYRSRRASLAALVLALSSPLPAAALGYGSWTLLVCWASLPWILARLARFGGIEPYGEGSGLARSGVTRSPAAQIAGLGVLLALVGAFAPVIVPLTLLLAGSLVVGSFLVGAQPLAALRSFVAAALASVVAVVLNAPTVVGWIQDPPPAEYLLGRPLAADVDGLGALLRADVGPVGNEFAGWAGLVLLGVIVLLGSGWRADWAARGLVVVAVAGGLAWATARGWMPVPMPDPFVILTLVSPVVAMGAGLGAVTYERDLALFRFGWRQPLVGVGVAALLIAPLPLIGQLADGRFGVPKTSILDAVGFIDEEVDDARVLWIGQPESLPVPGLSLSADDATATDIDHLRVAVTLGLPEITDQWPASSVAATGAIRRDLSSLLRGSTARIGRLLGRAGIRYVVVVERTLPSFEDALSGTDRPVGADVVDRFEQQLDLRLVSTDSAVTVFENRAWLPVQAVLPASLAQAAADGDLTPLADPDAFVAVRSGVGVADGDVATVASGEGIYSSARPADRWVVRVAGEPVDTTAGFALGEVAVEPGAGFIEVERTSGPQRLRLELFALALLWLVVWWLSLRGLAAEGRAVRARLLDEAERSSPIGSAEDVLDDEAQQRSRRRRRRERKARRAGRDRSERVSS